jgi:transcriptional repressor NrdR
MRRLYDLDKVAYVRFSSVYRSFQDLDEFMSELKDLIQERSTDDDKRARRAKPEKTKS